MRDNRDKNKYSMHDMKQINVVDTASKALQSIVYYPLNQGVYAMGQVVINRAQGVYAMGQVVINRAQGVHGMGQVLFNRAQGVSAIGQVIFVRNLVGA
jgi:hypothetical protein